jgi:ornithine cyclodeaminase
VPAGVKKVATPPAFVDDKTVARLLPAADVLAVIVGAFIDPPESPQRLAAECTDGPQRSRTLLAMPALRRGGLATIKVVTVIHGDLAGLSSHLLAFDPLGGLLAVIEAHQLTALRTAAASVLAAKALGAANARRLAAFGAGRQARAQVEAYASAMPLEAIVIWARRHEAALDLAAACAGKAPSVTVAATPRDAVRGADIVTCATASEAPLFSGGDIAPGTHVDLVGGFQPTMRETDDHLIARATIVADSRAALSEAGDLVQPIARGIIEPSQVLMLADILVSQPAVRTGEITLFKSVGHAAEDLVVTELLLERLGLFKKVGVSPGRIPSLPREGHADHD